MYPIAFDVWHIFMHLQRNQIMHVFVIIAVSSAVALELLLIQETAFYMVHTTAVNMHGTRCLFFLSVFRALIRMSEHQEYFRVLQSLLKHSCLLQSSIFRPA